jgi:hypothetical protein
MKEPVQYEHSAISPKTASSGRFLQMNNITFTFKSFQPEDTQQTGGIGSPVKSFLTGCISPECRSIARLL